MQLLWIIGRCSQCNSKPLEYHHLHILWHKWESLLQRDKYWMSIEIAVLHVISKDVSCNEQYGRGIRGLIILKDLCYMGFFSALSFGGFQAKSQSKNPFFFFSFSFSPLCPSLLILYVALISPHTTFSNKQFSSQFWQALNQDLCRFFQPGLNSSSNVHGNRWSSAMAHEAGQ